MGSGQPRFSKRRWRRPERLLLDHEPVMRRKDLGVTEPVSVEPEIGRRESRHHLQTILLAYAVGCAIEGVAVGLAVGHPFLATLAALIYGFAYFIVAREFGDTWIAKSLKTVPATAPRVTRLAAAEARDAGIPTPRVLVAPGDVPNATSFALRRRWLVTTQGAEALDELALEGLVAHEIVHLRDGDSAVAALYCVLAGSPSLAMGGAGVLAFLSLPLWPVALLMRAVRRSASPPGREMRADVAAAMLTRYPPGVAAALDASGGPSGGLSAYDVFWFVRRDGDTGEAAHRAGLLREM